MAELVSIVLPTKDAARTLRGSLESVRRQTYERWDLTVVDANSRDQTREIARDYGEVLDVDVGSTRGRMIGVEHARGEFILCLDADQLLSPTAIQHAVECGREVVAFGEQAAGSGLVGLVNRVDKYLIHQSWQANLDPVWGFIRPRFYRRSLILAAFRRIPDKILDVRPSPFSDDSLIFLESGVLPTAVGFVPDAIVHSEMEDLVGYLRKWRVYGQSAKIYRGTEYEFLVRDRGRRRLDPMSRLAVAPGLALRGIPFLVGYYL